MTVTSRNRVGVLGSAARDARLVGGGRQLVLVNRNTADEGDGENGEGKELAHVPRLRRFRVNRFGDERTVKPDAIGRCGEPHYSARRVEPRRGLPLETLDLRPTGII